jgi:peroxiredoxin
MTSITVLADGDHTVRADVRDGRVLIGAEDLAPVLGWTLKPQGLCRDDTCVPVRDGGIVVGDRVDLVAVADALGRPAVFDEPSGVVAVGEPSDLRRRALSEGVAPPFELPDVDGRPHGLADYRGDKKVLVAFATWCGCAYELPGWQALRDELAQDGLEVIAVALDDDAEAVRPFTEGIDLPVLVDRDHVLAERYAISNVPTVVWIDEDDHIARPNSVAFGSDTFREFTGVASEPHHDAIRAWVRTGAVDVDAAPGDVVGDLSDDELQARLRFRIGAHLRRCGDTGGAERNLSRAVALAPYDWTVRRAAMPLRGMDPFGADFFEMAAEWEAAGSPYHGIPAERTDPA